MSQSTLRPGTSDGGAAKSLFTLIAANSNRLIAQGGNVLTARK
jgi:hypothetical protein